MGTARSKKNFCDAGVTQNLPALPELTLLTVTDE
jgi:hypothetical protein